MQRPALQGFYILTVTLIGPAYFVQNPKFQKIPGKQMEPVSPFQDTFSRFAVCP